VEDTGSGPINIMGVTGLLPPEGVPTREDVPTRKGVPTREECAALPGLGPSALILGSVLAPANNLPSRLLPRALFEAADTTEDVGMT